MLARWLSLLIITHLPHFIRFVKIARGPYSELSQSAQWKLWWWLMDIHECELDTGPVLPGVLGTGRPGPGIRELICFLFSSQDPGGDQRCY